METTGEKFYDQDKKLISMNTYLAAQGEPLKEATGTENDVEKKTNRKKKKKKNKVDESDGFWDRMNRYLAAKRKPLKHFEDRTHKLKNKIRNKRNDSDALTAENSVSNSTTASRHLKKTTGIPG